MGAATRRRRSIVREVLEQARATGDMVAPWTRVPEVREHFADEGDLLVELHREWVRLLVGRLHSGEIVAQRTPANVRDVYDAVAAENPTLRRVLDVHVANPVLWESTALEHAMLARIAGLTPEGTEPEVAAATGRALVVQRIPAQRSAIA